MSVQLCRSTSTVSGRGDGLHTWRKSAWQTPSRSFPLHPRFVSAYARDGEREAIGRWLERFTDPSDPGALDPVHVALGRFQLVNCDFDAAENHIHAVQSPAARDPILGELVVLLADRDEDRASAGLLLIEDQVLRSDLAKKLSAKASASEVLIHRSVVAAGESPQALPT